MMKLSLLVYVFTFYSAIPVLPQNFINSLPEDRDLNSAIEYLSKFITSSEFDSLKLVNDDIVLIDTLYKKALYFFDYDYSEALLALSLATLPYNKIPATIPVLNLELDIPFPSVADSLFNLKRSKLPKNIFFDSPDTDFGDKDKPPHFFGSAFLSYNIGIFNLSKFMGILIELFEETFKVEGSVDSRDLMVNQLGILFGRMLNNNENLVPSKILNIYNLFHIKNIY